MAPSSNSKANPNGYKPKGKKPTNFKKHIPLSREEQAAVDEFRAFYAESSKSSNEKKKNEKSSYEPADYDTPKPKMENPLPPGAKGLAASRWAVKKEEEDTKPLLPEGTRKEPTNFKKHFTLSREEQAAVDEFRAFFAESPKSKERKNDEKSSYQPADHNTPRAKMENPLPAGAKGLSASRWAVKKEDTKPLLPEGTKGLAHSRFAKEEPKDRAPFVPPISTTSTSKAKARYSKKFGPTPEEDAAVKAFFAESPKDKEQKENGESFYQAADHETPRAKMENPLPPGAKGLAASRWAKKEDSFLVPPISTTSTSSI